jgi:hypothetical protein
MKLYYLACRNWKRATIWCSQKASRCQPEKGRYLNVKREKNEQGKQTSNIHVEFLISKCYVWILQPYHDFF